MIFSGFFSRRSGSDPGEIAHDELAEALNPGPACWSTCASRTNSRRAMCRARSIIRFRVLTRIAFPRASRSC